MSDKGAKRMAGTQEMLDHERRISRIEGIIEEIRTRLAKTETDQRDMRRELHADIQAVLDHRSPLAVGHVQSAEEEALGAG